MKTALLNFFRKMYANSFGEIFLKPIVRGRKVNSLPARFVPMPSLFIKPSWRDVERNGLRFRLDISDMVDWHVYFDFQDPVLPYLLNVLSDESVMLDVGTNIGFIALSCAQKIKQGKVYGFEPSTYNYQKCLENVKLNLEARLEVQQMGLGKSPDTLSLRSNNQNNHGMNFIDLDNTGDAEKITIDSLDNFVQRSAITRIDLLKIDVEGFEFDVLQGGIQSIQRFKPTIVLEVNENFLRRYGASCHHLFDWFKSIGYELFTLQHIRITDAETLSAKHQDIVAKPVLTKSS